MPTTFIEQEATPNNDAIASETIKGSVAKPAKSVTVALTFMISCVTLLMTGFAIIIPVFPQRLQALGLGAGTLALMEGAFGLGMFLFSTPMGTWAGRVGRKPILFISLAGFIVTNLALAFVNIPLLFILIRFIEGMLISGLMPVSMAMVGDTIPQERQGRWIGFITTAQATGIALGPGIGGFLYQAMGFVGPFVLSAGIALVASLLALILVPETLPEHVRLEAIQAKNQRGSKAKTAKDSRLIGLILLFAPFLIIDFGMIFTYPFAFPQYPFFFEKVLHYSTAQYGVIISAYGLALAVFPLFLGRLSEGLPKKPLIVIGSLLFGALNMFMFAAPLYPLLILGAILGGLGSALVSPAMGGIYLSATTDANRGKVMGMRGSAISLAVMLGPLTQALIGPWITPQITFAIGVIISLVMVIIASLLLKNTRQEGRSNVEQERALPRLH
ncbi:MFS transporter [Ktedonospora formicarum]|uniref:Tetracycline resistance MFS efflux pump n=1 Tax=Ktedonospora formicarum TaxID=2778364 RepID=A0A8J3MSG8_9CHLR|nr:MFS transporter [Ktedonospora formicarum]GHO44608.1 tetracycline resistance MFS efflux pump [Ktedonospora formicarum]